MDDKDKLIVHSEQDKKPKLTNAQRVREYYYKNREEILKKKSKRNRK